MAKLISLPNYATGRLLYIDPDKVSGVSDLIAQRPAMIDGAPSQVEIVGATVVCDGYPFHIAARCDDVAATVEEFRTRPFGFDLAKN